MSYADPDLETRGANPAFGNLVPSLTRAMDEVNGRIARRKKAGLTPDPKDARFLAQLETVKRNNIEHRRSRGLPVGLENRSAPSPAPAPGSQDIARRRAQLKAMEATR